MQSLHLLYTADINLAQQAYESGNIERARELLQAHTSAAGDSPGFEWYYLRHLLHSVKETLKAPDRGLISVSTSPDGNTLAIGAGRKVELRGIGAGETKSAIIPLPDNFKIGSLAISRDSKMLAVGDAFVDDEATVRLYDTTSLKELGSLKESSDSANALVFTPDGKTLIVGGGDGSVILWDVNSSRKPDIIPLEGTINLAVSPDGKMLVTGDDKGTLKLWDMASFRELLTLRGKPYPIRFAAFSPDGKNL